MTGRVLAVLLASSGVALAAPKRKVKIETDPPGATVYLNAKEDGPVCTTPCTIDVPVGDTPIIVELENHKQLFENLTVGRRPVSVKYKLHPAIGSLHIKGPAGARITVDDEDKGKAPAKIEVPAGPHTVVLTVDGKPIATEFVDVAANDEVVVEGEAKQTAEADPDGDTDIVDDDTTSSSSTSVGETGQATKPRARGPYVEVALAMDVGFRSFEYAGSDVSTILTPEKEGGQVMVGPYIELYPGTLLGIGALRGLSLLARFGYGVNSQTVEQNMMPTSAKTFWRSFETSLRHRWTIKNTVTLEPSVGYVRDQYQFEGDVDDIRKVPDADYQSVRLGGRISVLAGSIEPYLTIENRFVLSAGALQDRFDSASANGFRGAVGLEASFGAVGVRVEGALNYYSWTFAYDSSMDEFRADSGTDSIKLITAAIGYAY